MKTKKLKKMSLNKRAISKLSQESIVGGNTTVIIILPPKTTLCSDWCADTKDDYTCWCTVA